MKTYTLLALLVLHCASGAQAQTNTSRVQDVPTANPTNVDELKLAQQLLNVDSLWNRRLDFEENEATIVEVAAHLRKQLGEEAPIIEVRVEDETRSTFQLKKAPIGPMLSSVAALANAQLWALPGRLIMAPEKALDSTEREQVKQKMGGEWKQRDTKWSSSRTLSKAILAAVGDEIKERAIAKGVEATTPLPSPQLGMRPLPYKLLFSDLSPTTQKLLQDLLYSHPRLSGIAPSELRKFPTLAPSTIVMFNDTETQTGLHLQKLKANSATNVEELGSWYFQKPRPPLLPFPQ